ncbi:MAG: glycosyltransferase family 4 protein [Phycisphaerae bacterium]|jgi:glycosyltransferase involved in cell wall biosynthesis|nr:glycosyltransferase family 4 protein [Phycisphaerae bacterium]
MISNRLRFAATYLLLASAFGIALAVARLSRILPRVRRKPSGRVLVTGTFHNPGWYRSHIAPLARSGVQEVLLVVDEPQSPMARVRFVCPPRWLSRLISRAGAKFVWTLMAGVRYAPDLIMGYHIIPAALSALIVGKLVGSATCYQMTGGPLEIVGGGFASESWLTANLGGPCPSLERLAINVISQFDTVVVRGHKARAFLRARRITSPVHVITGSADITAGANGNRYYDLAFVGRMAPIKQPDQFVETVAEVRRSAPGLRAVMVGEGPLLSVLQIQASEAGVGQNISFLGRRSDVRAILAQSKVFVLTSRSEGLSIAMLEAMAAGAVPVVADVGELGELVTHGTSGFLVQPNRIGGYCDHILSLLSSEERWRQFSRAAAQAAGRCSIEAVAERWRCCIGEAIRSAYPAGREKGSRL